MASQQKLFSLSPTLPLADERTGPLTRNRVHQGDCLQLLRQLPDGCIDLVFADPPFNIGYEYDVYDDSRPADDYLQWCREWIAGVHRALKPDGTFWLAIGDEYAAELKIESQQAGFFCRSWVIWYYTFGVNCVRGFSRSHTHLFQFVKDPSQFTFNSANPRNRVPSARQLVYGDARANPKGRLPDNTWIYRPQDVPSSFRPQHDTWYFARVAGTFKERLGFHGCQMPEQLLGRIIRVSSHPNDLVLDPFSGSGTTTCVAKKLGRQWLGFELSEEYVDAVNQRLERTGVGDPLDGPEDPLASAPRTSQGKRRTTHPDQDQQVREALRSIVAEVAPGKALLDLRCSPELQQGFAKACRRAKVPGHERYWHQQLTLLEKSRQLKKGAERAARVPESVVERVSVGCDIALRLMAVDYGLSLDAILGDSDWSNEFDRIAEEFAPGFEPEVYRRVAHLLVQRAPRSRKLADQHWPERTLPSAALSLSLSDEAIGELGGPAVYQVSHQDCPLYIGETRDLAGRLAALIENDSWTGLGPETIQVWTDLPAAPSTRLGLQSRLVDQHQPVLNARFSPLPDDSAPA